MSKLKLKTKLAIVLTAFLSGCGGAPTVEDAPQCSPYFEYVTINQKVYIDAENSACFCRMFHFGEDYVGPQIGSVNWVEPIKNCDRVVGWRPTIYSKIASYWEELRAYLVRIREGHKK